MFYSVLEMNVKWGTEPMSGWKSAMGPFPTNTGFENHFSNQNGGGQGPIKVPIIINTTSFEGRGLWIDHLLWRKNIIIVN